MKRRVSAECLRSVQGFADEMVVVDTGSTDATVAIAEAAGARVEQIEWPGDFAPARNQALEFLNGDWVLVLDADEQLRARGHPRTESPDGPARCAGDQPAALRGRGCHGALFQRQSSVPPPPLIRWSRPYHSMIDDSVRTLLDAEPQWRIADCSEPAILHDGYRPELLAGSDKADRLRQAMEADLQERPGDPYASAKLGGLLISEGKNEDAIPLLENGLKQCGSAGAERYELLLHLGLALTPSDPDKAVSCYRQALEIPLDTRVSLGARLNLAARLMEQGNLEEAISLTQTAAQRAPEVALAWYNLGLMQRRRGDLAAALEAYGRALSLDPNNAECHQNNAVAQLLGGNIDAARSSFIRAINLLQAQGNATLLSSCARRVQGVVKLDGEAVA